MGNLLGSPVTDKETHTGETTPSDNEPPSSILKWGLSSMQGWRVHMEDAHIAEGKLYALHKEGEGGKTVTKIALPGHALFAVFDGHGGTFSAEYAGRNFLRVLSKQSKFVEYAQKLNDSSVSKQTLQTILEQALKQAFVETDYEIAMAIRGQPVEHANHPYHADGGGAENDDMGHSTSNDNNDDTTMRDAAGRAAAEHVQALDDDGDSGTTACMVMVTPDSIICANAGDSRAIFSRKNSASRTAIALSYDHKPDDEVEERRIRAAGGYVAGGRVEGDLAVSRGLGDFRFKNMNTVLNNTQLFPKEQPNQDGEAMNTTTTIDEADSALLPPGDQKVSPIPDVLIHARNHDLDEYIIVACDGIWDVQSNPDCVQEVHQMIQEGESDLGLISEELLDTCLRLGSKDNMTAIVVQMPGLQLPSDGGTGVKGRREEREATMKAHEEDDGESQEEDNGNKEVEESSDEEEKDFTTPMQQGSDVGEH